jgi:hypothetical protein
MYWNNPLIELTFPNNKDPILESFHNGRHCLFYNPAIDKNQIRYSQSLQDICDWANQCISNRGVTGFIKEQKNWYDIANIVKLNMWIDDIQKQGIVKPMMLYYDGKEKYGINNGESRLRALERIPAITIVQGFISTTVEYASKFDSMTLVTSFAQFAKICQAVDGQQFLFTLTDADAPYGIYWYEYNSCRTALVTPGENYCVQVLALYLNQHPHTKFTPEWFDQIITWSDYTV